MGVGDAAWGAVWGRGGRGQRARGWGEGGGSKHWSCEFVRAYHLAANTVARWGGVLSGAAKHRDDATGPARPVVLLPICATNVNLLCLRACLLRCALIASRQALDAQSASAMVWRLAGCC